MLALPSLLRTLPDDRRSRRDEGASGERGKVQRRLRRADEEAGEQQRQDGSDIFLLSDFDQNDESGDSLKASLTRTLGDHPGIADPDVWKKLVER